MTKYRKKPVVVEAVQFDGNLPRSEWPRGVFVHTIPSLAGLPYVITIHGQATSIQHGDWIIPEPDGEHFYPCKPDIFAATYEPASSPSTEKAE